MKRITLFIIIISIAVTLSACDSGEEARLIRELYEELESKTEYCEGLQKNNERLSRELSEAVYERNAFLGENVTFRYEQELKDDQLFNYSLAARENFNNYAEYRSQNADVYLRLTEIDALPYFEEV